MDVVSYIVYNVCISKCEIIFQRIAFSIFFSLFLGSLNPILLDTCQNGTLKRGAFTKLWTSAPKVPKILPNCTFNFCARVSEPYINEGCKSGLEVEIIRVLRQKLKFKVNNRICVLFLKMKEQYDFVEFFFA